LTSIVHYIPELAEYEDLLDEISHYGVEVRYPYIFYEPTLEEAQKSAAGRRFRREIMGN